jgi:uncharacterized protein (DUF2141 family)
MKKGFADMRALLMVPAMFLIIGAAPTCDVVIAVEKMRSAKGVLQICLTAREQHFPDCENDPKARRMTVKASAAIARFKNLPAGSYAAAIVHDENANDRLDKFIGIPKEGIGFSRNPKFSFGPPKFRNAVFNAQSGEVRETINLKYYL